jgi:N-acyl-phosphatidylethanolamine-hydrolysing phospholipase D
MKINNNLIFLSKNRNYVSFNLKDLMSEDIEDGIMENSNNNNDLYPKCRYEDGKYISPWCNKTKKTLMSVINWQLEKPKKLNFPNLKDSQEALQHIKINKNVLNNIDKPHATWMGHASCYFQSEGVFFLTDPMWSDRASPTQLIGPKRYTYPPIDLEELHIDVILLSHTHYDHLDYNSAMKIGNKSLW